VGVSTTQERHRGRRSDHARAGDPRTGQRWLLEAGSGHGAGRHPQKGRNSGTAALWRRREVSRDERPEIYNGLFMSPRSSLDKATRRWDLSQQGDVLCMKVTAESREARRAAGCAGAPRQAQHKGRERTETGGAHGDSQ